ncbi:MAG: hypothetical protein ACLGHQ_03150 [Acidimicrobiia bacterium]
MAISEPKTSAKNRTQLGSAAAGEPPAVVRTVNARTAPVMSLRIGRDPFVGIVGQLAEGA